VHRLGSVLLTAVLLGVPRALNARAFGAVPRWVFVQVSPLDPLLADFTVELERAIEAASCRLAGDARDAPVVVEIHSVWTARAARGPRTEAVSVTVRRRHEAVPLVVQYPPGRRSDAAHALIQALPRGKEGT